ncbi:hypothetical protein ASF61_14165 [Duganella sp. Leaf126]|uniref:DUF2812 domain-containing protein n=1 Tax=Duganella sp. Leaf126 TaxID=1736266 RepID=UPI0006FC1B78|nr:DUF2812 domain-containing protein [Duganella sp. Leaf126]KQQ32681.1 hypothetical protein ASF61_14165 [Duganella sp. Leaf126]
MDVRRKIKFWWPWQDLAEQEWLTQQAAQGLHLRSVGVLGSYRFTRGEPRDMVYRMDIEFGPRRTHYRQLYADAGWEHVASYYGWQYWRTPRAADGSEAEIFTDDVSKRAKFKRILWYLGISTLPALVVAVHPNTADLLRQQPLPLAIGVRVLLYGLIGMNLLAAGGVLSRMRRLRAL